MKVTILGSGTSHGVPMIGCKCNVCQSANPKNTRFRPSILVEYNGRNILVDTTPELRMQSLKYDLNRVDAVLITHVHADHIFGLDDLRRFNDMSGNPIPVYANAVSGNEIRKIFPYIFNPPQLGGGIPRVELREISGDFELFDIPVQAVPVLHGKLNVLGFRFGNFAYVTDTNYIPETSMEKLMGLDVLILDAVRYEPHPTHFGLEQALEVCRLLAPKQTYFTHLSHKFDHDAVNATLPGNAQLAYDGQIIELD